MEPGRKLGEGREAEIFEWGSDLAIKLYRNPDANNAAEREAEITSAVAAAGAPVPACHGTAVVDDRVGLVLDRLGGPTMGEIITPDNALEYLGQLAELHAEVHACSAPAFDAMAVRMQPRIERAAPEELVGGLVDTLRQRPDGDTLLHSDFHPFNVVGDGKGNWKAIDWTVGVRGPAEADICRTVYLLAYGVAPDDEGPITPPDLAPLIIEFYLQAYEQHAEVRRDEIDAWMGPIMAARLVENIPEERPAIRERLRQMAEG